jgi:hypothetical protein
VKYGPWYYVEGDAQVWVQTCRVSQFQSPSTSLDGPVRTHCSSSGNHIILGFWVDRSHVVFLRSIYPGAPFSRASHRQKMHQILFLRRRLKSSSRCGPSSSNFTCIPWKGMCQERDGESQGSWGAKREFAYSSIFFGCTSCLGPCLIRVCMLRR